MVASADTLRFSLVEESVPGVVPTNPIWKECRITGETLVFAYNSTTSNELGGSGRARKDSILLGGESSGGLNFELHHSPYIEMLYEGLLGSHWGSDPRLTGNTGVDFIYVADQMETYCCEKRWVQDPNGPTYGYHRFYSLLPDTHTITITPNAPITGSFGFVGGAFKIDQAELIGATYVADSIDPVMTAPLVTGITLYDADGDRVFEVATTCFTNLVINIANNSRGIACIGYMGNHEVVLGTFDATIDFSVYYANDALLEALIAQTDYKLVVEVRDSPGNWYTYTFPRVRISNAAVNAAGTGQDVLLTGSMTAMEGVSPANYAMMINRGVPTAVSSGGAVSGNNYNLTLTGGPLPNSMRFTYAITATGATVPDIVVDFPAGTSREDIALESALEVNRLAGGSVTAVALGDVIQFSPVTPATAVTLVVLTSVSTGGGGSGGAPFPSEALGLHFVFTPTGSPATLEITGTSTVGGTLTYDVTASGGSLPDITDGVEPGESAGYVASSMQVLMQSLWSPYVDVSLQGSKLILTQNPPITAITRIAVVGVEDLPENPADSTVDADGNPLAIQQQSLLGQVFTYDPTVKPPRLSFTGNATAPGFIRFEPDPVGGTFSPALIAITVGTGQTPAQSTTKMLQAVEANWSTWVAPSLIAGQLQIALKTGTGVTSFGVAALTSAAPVIDTTTDATGNPLSINTSDQLGLRFTYNPTVKPPTIGVSGAVSAVGTVRWTPSAAGATLSPLFVEFDTALGMTPSQAQTALAAAIAATWSTHTDAAESGGYIEFAIKVGSTLTTWGAAAFSSVEAPPGPVDQPWTEDATGAKLSRLQETHLGGEFVYDPTALLVDYLMIDVTLPAEASGTLTITPAAVGATLSPATADVTVVAGNSASDLEGKIIVAMDAAWPTFVDTAIEGTAVKINLLSTLTSLGALDFSSAVKIGSDVDADGVPLPIEVGTGLALTFTYDPTGAKPTIDVSGGPAARPGEIDFTPSPVGGGMTPGTVTVAVAGAATAATVEAAFVTALNAAWTTYLTAAAVSGKIELTLKPPITSLGRSSWASRNVNDTTVDGSGTLLVAQTFNDVLGFTITYDPTVKPPTLTVSAGTATAAGTLTFDPEFVGSTPTPATAGTAVTVGMTAAAAQTALALAIRTAWPTITNATETGGKISLALLGGAPITSYGDAQVTGVTGALPAKPAWWGRGIEVQFDPTASPYTVEAVGLSDNPGNGADSLIASSFTITPTGTGVAISPATVSIPNVPANTTTAQWMTLFDTAMAAYSAIMTIAVPPSGHPLAGASNARTITPKGGLTSLALKVVASRGTRFPDGTLKAVDGSATDVGRVTMALDYGLGVPSNIWGSAILDSGVNQAASGLVIIKGAATGVGQTLGYTVATDAGLNVRNASSTNTAFNFATDWLDRDFEDLREAPDAFFADVPTLKGVVAAPSTAGAAVTLLRAASFDPSVYLIYAISPAPTGTTTFPTGARSAVAIWVNSATGANRRLMMLKGEQIASGDQPVGVSNLGLYLNASGDVLAKQGASGVANLKLVAKPLTAFDGQALQDDAYKTAAFTGGFASSVAGLTDWVGGSAYLAVGWIEEDPTLNFVGYLESVPDETNQIMVPFTGWNLPANESARQADLRFNVSTDKSRVYATGPAAAPNSTVKLILHRFMTQI